MYYYVNIIYDANQRAVSSNNFVKLYKIKNETLILNVVNAAEK